MASNANAGAGDNLQTGTLFKDDGTPAKGRPRGVANRNYPNMILEQALSVARAIQDEASGMGVSRLTLADLMKKSPDSSTFRELLQASRAYGFTKGGATARHFELTALGEAVTNADRGVQVQAIREAVLGIPAYRQFLEAFNGKKIPNTNVCKDHLTKKAIVSAERAGEFLQFVFSDARFAGFIRKAQAGGEYIDLQGTPMPAARSAELDFDSEGEGEVAATSTTVESPTAPAPRFTVVPNYEPADDVTSVEAIRPSKVFVAHGKDRKPLEQVKDILDQLKVEYAVAIDEPNGGRPISAKVASLMRDECSSAIFIFTADERFQKVDDKGNLTEVWRPSENAVYELGAASILYDRRIVIFKDERVNLPSDFSDLGHISFSEGQIAMQVMPLLKELVSLGIVEVHAPGAKK